MTPDADFVSGMFEDLGKPPSVQENTQYKENLYTQLKYGLVALFFGIAKKRRWKEAKESGELKGSAQVVVQPDGWMRAYEGAANEPRGTTPVLMPYIKPGTGWKFENRNDGENVCVSRPEYNGFLIYAVLYKPLYQPVKEMVEGAISLMESEAKVRKGKSLMDAFIHGLLTLAVEKCWNDEFTHSLDLIVNAKKNRNGQVVKLTLQQKRMAMRGALLCLNEENLKKRSEKRRGANQPNLQMADTERGRSWDSDASYEHIEEPGIRRVAAPRFRETNGNGSIDLDELASMLLAQTGNTDLGRLDQFHEVDNAELGSNQFAEIEY